MAHCHGSEKMRPFELCCVEFTCRGDVFEVFVSQVHFWSSDKPLLFVLFGTSTLDGSKHLQCAILSAHGLLLSKEPTNHKCRNSCFLATHGKGVHFFLKRIRLLRM